MTIPDRKPRADCKLKTLPTETQAEIAEYARTHSLRATAEWLTAQGVPAGFQQISRFLSWHAARQNIHKNDGTWEALQEERRHGNPLLHDRDLDALGMRHFALSSIEKDDLRGFVAVRKLALSREKFEFDATLFCRRELPALYAIDSDPTLSQYQKTQLFMQKMFGRCPGNPHVPPPACEEAPPAQLPQESP